MTAALNGNKTANINVKNAVYTNVDGDIHAWKTAKIIKSDITQQHVDISATCWQPVSPLMLLLFLMRECHR